VAFLIESDVWSLKSSVWIKEVLFLLMTIPVQLFFVFVFPHFLPALLYNTSHGFSSKKVIESLGHWVNK